MLYAGSGPNQAFVENPNELVVPGSERSPGLGPRCRAKARCTASAAGRERLTFTQTLSLPGGHAAAAADRRVGPGHVDPATSTIRPTPR